MVGMVNSRYDEQETPERSRQTPVATDHWKEDMGAMLLGVFAEQRAPPAPFRRLRRTSHRNRSVRATEVAALTSAIAYGCGVSGLRGLLTYSLISGSGTLRNGFTAIKRVPWRRLNEERSSERPGKNHVDRYCISKLARLRLLVRRFANHLPHLSAPLHRSSEQTVHSAESSSMN